MIIAEGCYQLSRPCVYAGAIYPLGVSHTCPLSRAISVDYSVAHCNKLWQGGPKVGEAPDLQ